MNGFAAECGRALLDLVVVRRCHVCDEHMPPEPRRVCDACLSAFEDLSFEGEAVCERCSLPVGGGRSPCPGCRVEPFPFRRAAAFGLYEGALRDAVLRLKLRPEPGLSAPLGRLVARAAARLDEPGLIVPVPMHASRFRERGFDQAAALAGVAAKWLGVEWDDRALTRPSSVEHQIGGTKSRRRANVRRAFAADPLRVRGRAILLVDDVLTTGATASACARVLREAGAASVDVVVIARAAQEASA